VTNYLLKKGQFLFEVYEPRDRSWITMSPTMAFSTGLTVANFGVRGTDPEHLRRAYARSFHYKPDVVFIQTGTSDAIFRTPAQYEEDLIRLVDQVQKDGRLPVLITPIPAADPVPAADGVSPLARSEDMAERCRKLARARDLPLVDAHAAFMAGGELSLGEVYFDRTHLNILGHRFMGDLLYSMLSGNSAQIWNETPEAISDIIRQTPEMPANAEYMLKE
jgi:lysophospholipase L1-like esterase